MFKFLKKLFGFNSSSNSLNPNYKEVMKKFMNSDNWYDRQHAMVVHTTMNKCIDMDRYRAMLTDPSFDLEKYKDSVERFNKEMNYKE